MKTVSSLISIAIALLAGSNPAANAGTVNIDLQHVSSITAADTGVIGSGTVWNGVYGTRSDLVNDKGAVTPTGITFIDVGGASFGQGLREVHKDIIYKDAGDFTIKLKVSGLRAGEFYKIVLFHGRQARQIRYTLQPGTAAEQSRIATGVTASPPGTENADYVVFENAGASLSGEIFINAVGLDPPSKAGICAGIQIQGWLDQELFPWRSDLSIAKKLTAAYEGDDVYSSSQMKTQVSRGGRKVSFFSRIQNDGELIGRMQFSGSNSNKRARRVYRDLNNGGANITAAVISGTFLVELEPGQIRTVSMAIDPKGGSRRKKRTIIDSLNAIPESAPVAGFGDSVTARTIVRNR